MKQHNKKRGIVAGAFALVTAAALALGGAAAANAAPITETTGSLTIHKLADQGATLGSATGQETDRPAGAAGIPGVTYKITKLAPNLGTNAGWIAAGEMTVDAAETWIANNPGAATSTDTTDAAGVVEFGVTGAGLAIGQYYVEETLTPNGVTPAGPFLVTVPVTNPTNDGWIYDVHVFPKNSKVDIGKTVADAIFDTNGVRTENYAVGGNVTWTIDTAVPVNRDTNVENATYGDIVAPAGFAIFDTLTDAELTYASSSVRIESSATTPVVTPLATPGDYSVVSEDNGTGTHTVKFVFTPDGLIALKDAAIADPKSRVVVDLVTTVKDSGVITNNATVFPDSSGSVVTDQGLMTTTPATIKYGKYSFTKVSNDVNATVLAGAKFRVYATEAQAKAGGNDFLTVNNENEWTSDANGLVEIDGLRFSDWFDNGTQTSHSYWLVETKAPADHQLIVEPIAITVNAVDTAGGNVVNISTANQPGFVLPLTGGMGTAFLTVIGLGIIGFVVVVARRRRNAEAAN